MAQPIRFPAARRFLIVALLLSLAATARAQDEPAKPAVAFQFPANPASWINYGPLSAESLAGKAAVLYFYEESCPRCKERWPEILRTAQQFDGQPVVFIAVNSGTARGSVESYVRAQRISWPVIVDSDRMFERFCGVPEVNLQNIYQVAILRPDGTLARGNAGDLAGTARAALKDAAWRVDPTGLPPSFKPAWLQMELGNFKPAAALIKKGLTSSDEEYKAAAEKFDQAVQKLIEPLLTQAAEHLEKDEKWPAYKLYYQVQTQYAGFRLPPEVDQQTKRLSEDLDVMVELAAMQTLQAAKKVGARGSDAATRRAANLLRKLVADAPKTEAAAQATALLQQIDGPKP